MLSRICVLSKLYFQNLHQCTDASAILQRLIPLMKEGKLSAMLSSALCDRSLLFGLDALRPGCLSRAFETIFCSDSVREALSAAAQRATILRAPIACLCEVSFIPSVIRRHSFILREDGVNEG